MLLIFEFFPNDKFINLTRFSNENSEGFCFELLQGKLKVQKFIKDHKNSSLKLQKFTSINKFLWKALQNLTLNTEVSSRFKNSIVVTSEHHWRIYPFPKQIMLAIPFTKNLYSISHIVRRNYFRISIFMVLTYRLRSRGNNISISPFFEKTKAHERQRNCWNRFLSAHKPCQ